MILWLFIWHHQWVKLTYPVKHLKIYQINRLKCCTDIQGPKRLNRCDFSDHGAFYLAPPTGHSFTFLVEYLKIYQMLPRGGIQTA